MRLSIALLLLCYCYFTKAETFTLAQTGNWDAASTWTTPSGTHTGGPGIVDDVIMTDPGQGNPMLTVILNGNVSIRSLNYDGDYRRNSLEGTGILTLIENSSWVGGIIGGNVELVVLTGKELTLAADLDSSNRKVLADNAKITNGGTMTWEGNGIFFYGSALIENNALFVKNTDSNWLYSETNSTVLAFINKGTFNCNGQEFLVNIYFQNTSSGTLNIFSGAMIFTNLVSNEGVINLHSSGSQNHKLLKTTEKLP